MITHHDHVSHNTNLAQLAVVITMLGHQVSVLEMTTSKPGMIWTVETGQGVAESFNFLL